MKPHWLNDWLNEKKTLFAYIEEFLRSDISGQWRKIRNTVRCTKIHLGDPSGYFHLLAIFRKVLFVSSFLPIWSAARKIQTRTGSLLSAVEDKTNMALTKKPPRARIPVYSPPRRLKCLDRSRFRLSFTYFSFFASSKMKNSLDDIRIKKYWLNPSNR